MQKSDSMAPEYELDGHASSLIYAFKRGAKHLTDIFAYSKWTLPQKGSLLVDHVIISNCPSTPLFIGMKLVPAADTGANTGVTLKHKIDRYPPTTKIVDPEFGLWAEPFPAAKTAPLK